jgi:hypothetical protein
MVFSKMKLNSPEVQNFIAGLVSDIELVKSPCDYNTNNNYLGVTRYGWNLCRHCSSRSWRWQGRLDPDELYRVLHPVRCLLHNRFLWRLRRQ